MSLLHRAARGGALLGAGQAAATIFGWVRTFILARLLTPDDFGLVGMATVLLGFAGLLTDFGLSAALIQRKELEPGHKDAAFWTGMAMGTGLFALFAAGAPLLAMFYAEPRVTPITIATGTSLLLTPLWSTHATMLRRELKFGQVAKIELARNVFAGIVSIVLALLGFGYWSIVAGPFASHLLAIPWYAMTDRNWRPGRRGTRQHARELFGFSLYVVGASTVNYLSANVDYLIVGKMLGAAPLGIYTLAYETMTFPLTRISSLFGAVMFPAFATIQDKPDEMRTHYVNVSRTLALVCFPILAWVAVTAPELVGLVYGQRWMPVVPILRALSVAGALKSVGTLVGTIFKARGKASVEFYWNVVWSIAVTIVVLIGIRWGSIGVAIGISAACIPGVAFTEWLACKYIDLPFSKFLRVLVLPAVAVGIATVAGFAARRPLESMLGEPKPLQMALRLLAVTAAMTVAYFGVLRLLHPPILREAKEFLGYFRKKR